MKQNLSTFILENIYISCTHSVLSKCAVKTSITDRERILTVGDNLGSPNGLCESSNIAPLYTLDRNLGQDRRVNSGTSVAMARPQHKHSFYRIPVHVEKTQYCARPTYRPRPTGACFAVTKACLLFSLRTRAFLPLNDTVGRQ